MFRIRTLYIEVFTEATQWLLFIVLLLIVPRITFQLEDHRVFLQPTIVQLATMPTICLISTPSVRTPTILAQLRTVRQPQTRRVMPGQLSPGLSFFVHSGKKLQKVARRPFTKHPRYSVNPRK